MTYRTIIFALAGFAATSWGQTRITVQVPASRAWTRTGITVDRGSTVAIDATGQIEAAPETDTRAFVHRVPPEGRERQDNKPQPTMRSLVMLARIGDGPIIEAGAHTEFTADRSGEIQLGINDDYLTDNSGSWTAQVNVRTGATATSQQRGSARNQDTIAPAGNSSQNPARAQNDLGTRGGQATAQQRPNAGPRNDNPSNYQDQTQRNGNRPYDDTDRSRYRPDDQYRPDYRGSDYYRRYGHGFGFDEAIRICEQTVLAQASRRFRTPDIHFHRTSIDDRPGRNDWVTGSLDIHRGARQEQYGFSCAVNFDTGSVRSAELDPRPLPDDFRR